MKAYITVTNVKKYEVDIYTWSQIYNIDADGLSKMKEGGNIIAVPDNCSEEEMQQCFIDRIENYGLKNETLDSTDFFIKVRAEETYGE